MALLQMFLSVAWALSGPQIPGGKQITIDPGVNGTAVIFLSAKCPCSQSHVQELKNLRSEFADFAFIAIHSNPDESKSEVEEYFKHVELSFPVLRDRQQEWANKFKANRTPHAFVIDKAGQVVYRGGVTDSKNCDPKGRRLLREALLDVRAEVAVRTPESRSLGCAISRRGPGDW